MSLSANVLARSADLRATPSPTDKPPPATLLLSPIRILTLPAFHTQAEQLLVRFLSFCCHSAVTLHPAVVNSSPQKPDASLIKTSNRSSSRLCRNPPFQMFLGCVSLSFARLGTSAVFGGDLRRLDLRGGGFRFFVCSQCSSSEFLPPKGNTNCEQT